MRIVCPDNSRILKMKRNTIMKKDTIIIDKYYKTCLEYYDGFSQEDNVDEILKRELK